VISKIWEGDRAKFEQALRDGLQIPTVLFDCSVNRWVYAPMEDFDITQRREQAAEEGRMTKGRSAIVRLGGATISFCDHTGDLLGHPTRASAGVQKKTLKEGVAAEVGAILVRGQSCACSNSPMGSWIIGRFWRAAPAGEELIDFFHASEHVHEAIASVTETQRWKRSFGHTNCVCSCAIDVNGVDKVIRAMKHLASKHPQKKLVRRALIYFRTNRARMRYAELKAKGFPIARALWKQRARRLVTQRLKLSGMRWSTAEPSGAHASSWDQSGAIRRGVAIIAASFSPEVTALPTSRA